MKNLPGHFLPTYSDESREDALYHYTTANGLLGIIQSKQIWSTAHYCSNDESELSWGKDVLTPILRSKTHQMIKEEDPMVNVFRLRGVNIINYADKFEQRIRNYALHVLCVYITCFYKPVSKEDFLHGLLSQWRGYGEDGGYALQFSRKKLEEQISQISKDKELNYELQDVHYSTENPLKENISFHSEAFVKAYLEHLDRLADWDFGKEQVPSPLTGLSGGPIESLLDFLIHTKNEHFSEENECRMSVLEPVSAPGALEVDYLNRNGLIVPYTKTPEDLNILDCVDWIIVGPGSRMEARFNSISQLVRKKGLDIQVRPSHIPFSRS